VGSLALLAGCQPFFEVLHRVDGPLTFDVRVLEDTLREQTVFRANPGWDPRFQSMSCIIERSPGWVLVWCNAQWPPPCGRVLVTSWWIDEVPSDDVLSASIVLQQEVVAMLARTVPGFPSPDVFRLEWNGLDGPDGDEFAAAKARWEARARDR
jgi:hypothetical protein